MKTNFENIVTKDATAHNEQQLLLPKRFPRSQGEITQFSYMS